ncbi:hypothetical protein ABT052_36415 [Streptomyces sp. NPDC002766]|uniref:hypothetical protein n=1 Tax=Streptomyces sp. NPDC002766 TaxID=3154429 RepID=UPI00331A8F5E
MTRMSRRTALLGAVGCLCGAAGCTDRSPRAAARSPATARAASASPSPRTPQGAGLPRTTPWRPTSAEVTPAAKLRAVRLVEVVGSRRPGESGTAAARSRVAALRLDPALVGQAGPLLPKADAAAVQVIDAQYGGILSDSASVLVVCRQWTRSADRVSAGGTTVDVRLVRAASGWTVTALHPAHPGAAESPPPSRVREILSDPRIELPAAARADLRSGQVHDSVLTAMLRLAGTYRMSVSVVRSGHPLDVFGTRRPSDHPRGRAFDVWRIDGHPVVDPSTSRALIERFMRDAAAAGSYNVGGPLRPSGGAAANQFFSDATHHDHVHVGFRT